MGIQDLLKDETAEIDESLLGALGKAANKLLLAQALVLEQEEALKQCKAAERKINQEEIPELMENLGLEKFTLSSGQTISVKEAVQCAIPAPRRDEAYKWLDANNHGDLIKTALTAKFGRGETESAIIAQNELARLGIGADLNESVHAGTLKAWAREELAQGHSLPADLFKVHVVKMTTVK